MKILQLELRAKEPLVITDGSAEGMTHSCLDYIPGNQLLGAFAAIWVRSHTGLAPDDSPEFQQLFLNGAVSWGSAFPLCGDGKCVPVPASFRREKNMAGLPLAGKNASGTDCEIFNELALPDGETLEGHWKNRNKGTGLVPKFKRLNASFMQPDSMRQPQLHKLWNTRVALGEERRALESQLFGFSALAAGTAFYSEIYCSDGGTCDLLRRLFESNRAFCIGHARSAGYGRVEITTIAEKDAQNRESRGRTLNIYLLSDYLPMPAWEDPRANLLQALELKFGQKFKPVKEFINYRQIDCFNSHWHKWRDSRTAIQAGSVLKIEASGEFAFQEAFGLGADQLEGYGRILINPPFLSAPEPAIPEELPAAAHKTRGDTQISFSGPVWHVLKERILERYAHNQALAWLGDTKWQEFLAGAQRLERPTASQRANLRSMSLADFKTMTEKSAGQQWKEQFCPNPFGNGNEYLDKIMFNLLDMQAFLRRFPIAVNAPFPQEKGELSARSYELFKHELLRAWGKQARIRQKASEEN